MKIIYKITKQEAIDSYRKENNLAKDILVEIEDDIYSNLTTTTLGNTMLSNSIKCYQCGKFIDNPNLHQCTPSVLC